MQKLLITLNNWKNNSIQPNEQLKVARFKQPYTYKAYKACHCLFNPDTDSRKGKTERNAKQKFLLNPYLGANIFPAL